MKRGRPTNAIRAVREDYAAVLVEAGIDARWVESITTNTLDLCPMPDEWSYIEVRPSLIHGKGIFSAIPIGAGDLICASRIGKYRTPAGRYVNHSPEPNARMAHGLNGGFDLIALQVIRPGEEILIDYRQSGAVQGWTFDSERGRLYKERLRGGQ